MDTSTLLGLACDPARILQARGLEADPWQRDLLLTTERQMLLCCSRQSGKSTTVAALTLHTALFSPDALVLLLSPSLRQSVELFRKVIDLYEAVGRPMAVRQRSQLRLELAQGGRIVSLPGRETTLRGFSGVTLLVLDEAARIPDELYASVRPMLAVSQGRLIALSTPFGRRGWFYRAWESDEPWHRVQISWRDCPRIAGDFIEEERKALGDNWVRQEYECEFTALEGAVYPDFATCLIEQVPALSGRKVGGIDFGWRNPFAALWGVLDRDDLLWIVGERYLRETPLQDHAQALRQQRGVAWYADPAGATEIAELRRAGLTVHRGDNAIRPGIAAVAARLRSGRLKVVAAACPNLIAEAQRYRYPSGAERVSNPENPVDEDNHALAALRYLIAKLDANYLARWRGKSVPSADSVA